MKHLAKEKKKRNTEWSQLLPSLFLEINSLLSENKKQKHD